MRPPVANMVNWVSIGSGNGLVPVWHQAIVWINADLSSIGPFNQHILFKGLHFEMTYA